VDGLIYDYESSEKTKIQHRRRLEIKDAIADEHAMD
jgi:hypothetical protein